MWADQIATIREICGVAGVGAMLGLLILSTRKRKPDEAPLIEVKIGPQPDPVRRFRVARGPHDELFRVQEAVTLSNGSVFWLNQGGTFEIQADAEEWIERELAGPKICKTYP